MNHIHISDQHVQSGPNSDVKPPRLLDQVALCARERCVSQPTTDALVSWIRGFILFHGARHPRELSRAAVLRFLEHAVRTEKEPLAALEASRSALELLYQHVLGMEIGDLPRPKPPRLLDQMSQVLRVRHYSLRTEACYLHWGKHLILFHGKRHPRNMGLPEVGCFLQHAAATQKDALRQVEAARSGLDFWYGEVLHFRLRELPWPKPPRLLDQVRQVMRVRHYALRRIRKVTFMDSLVSFSAIKPHTRGRESISTRLPPLFPPASPKLASLSLDPTTCRNPRRGAESGKCPSRFLYSGPRSWNRRRMPPRRVALSLPQRPRPRTPRRCRPFFPFPCP
jgi:hypothetical protein